MSSSQPPEAAGAVTSLWRYPVKSMGGEQLDEAVVTDGGFVGDRAYALIDQSSGKVASAKLPKKWGSLLHLGATFVEPPRTGAPVPPVRITWPDGAQAISDCEADSMLSERLGRRVRLTAARPGTVSVDRLDPLSADETIVDIGALMMEGRFADYAAIHIVTTASLARLEELCPEAQFNERRFRPNMVVNCGGDRRGFIENDWVGRYLAIGDEVRLRISIPLRVVRCRRCLRKSLLGIPGFCERSSLTIGFRLPCSAARCCPASGSMPSSSEAVSYARTTLCGSSKRPAESG